ncbi:MAG: zinc-binding dehydrogenase [Arsenophonus endosymbiont of Dermacentor nuttalli]
MSHSDAYYQQVLDILILQGKLALIDDSKTFDIMLMKRKALSLYWEFLFTSPIFQTEDMIKQHQLLQRVAGLIDQGLLKTTVSKEIGKISAVNLRLAHQLIESGQVKGNLVLSGF